MNFGFEDVKLNSLTDHKELDDKTWDFENSLENSLKNWV